MVGALLEGESPDGPIGWPVDWRFAVAQPYARAMLSGGLTSENVAAAIRAVKLCAVGVREGVESASGRKGCIKLQTFRLEVERGKREAARSTAGRRPRLAWVLSERFAAQLDSRDVPGYILALPCEGTGARSFGLQGGD
ncbi:MAG: hypothetical protein CFK52_03735 [Chloracidobacterium sp. CP2_5A]|nr:MAG: hypothetical protein CFK52_03735 [Chloracidobacterium sp. CP2_5A]